jgi:single-stranded-DNA-specific exonuclease
MAAALDKRWVILRGGEPEQTDLLDYPPVLRQLLLNRGISDHEQAGQFLGVEGPLFSPFLMMNMEQVVERLMLALENAERVAIYGDYDVDGVTATVLMVQGLRRCGIDAREYIPNRFDEGYGLNKEALAALANEGVRLVITVDCGIRSLPEVAYARQLGLDLIVTDHHEPKDELPEALAIICPKQEGDKYPDKNLAGVGVAFKILQALVMRLPQMGILATEWLDLVAIGTVADVVPLLGENRSMVRAGLHQLRLGKRPGIVSLCGVSSVDLRKLTARDIGFAIGPRLNAAGRLESALESYRLLMANTLQDAGILAQRLDDHNRQRQELTRQMQETAENMAREKGMGDLFFAIHPDFNMGVVGLVAARLTEVNYRPSIIGYQGDEFVRASCRSIPEFHITHALDECSDLLIRHGGHAMAAGFTVSSENLQELEDRMHQIATRELGGRDLRPVLYADHVVNLGEMGPGEVQSMYRYIEQLEPTGLGNSEAAFVSCNLKVVESRVVGDGRHLKLKVRDNYAVFDAIAFRQGHWAGKLPEYIDIVYTFDRNIYMGNEYLQLNVRDIAPTGQKKLEYEKKIRLAK